MKRKIVLRYLLMPLIFCIVLAGCQGDGSLAGVGLETTSLPDEESEQTNLEDSRELFSAGQVFEPGQSWGASIGDFNQDGSLDIFSAGFDLESNKVWFNDGNGNFSSSGQPLDACVKGAVVDLNSDSAPDLVIADWDPDKELWSDSLQIWLNDGSGYFKQSGDLEVGSGTHTFAIGDLDGDGDPDLMVVGSGQNSVWLNLGDGKIEDTNQVLNAGIDSAIALGDLDGDGDLDALSGGWDGLPSVWINDGSGLMEKGEQGFSEPDLHIHGLALGDLDNDTDLDAFLVTAYGKDHKIWINDGTGEFSIQGNVPGPLGHDIALGDLDGDGDLDAVSAHGYKSYGNTRIWLNDGLGQFTQQEPILGSDFTAAVVLGDLDQDGDLDIFSSVNDWGNDPGAADRIWINEN